ncbi:hypothetical protein B0H16DRAFT_1480557 [Mycena metata]|uniref:Uncharacterized protein n=1 Tax=Mycena metata TaxID=1033252 RepID=A0AAD7H4A2_9AGAR|nr:hypothetical protein B0H16DRAFT_1480557 [Mycena metata]
MGFALLLLLVSIWIFGVRFIIGVGVGVITGFPVTIIRLISLYELVVTILISVLFGLLDVGNILIWARSQKGKEYDLLCHYSICIMRDWADCAKHVPDMPQIRMTTPHNEYTKTYLLNFVVRQQRWTGFTSGIELPRLVIQALEVCKSFSDKEDEAGY